MLRFLQARYVGDYGVLGDTAAGLVAAGFFIDWFWHLRNRHGIRFTAGVAISALESAIRIPFFAGCSRKPFTRRVVGEGGQS